MIVVISAIESYVVPFTVYFQLDGLVGGVLRGREVSVVGCAQAEDGVAGAQSNQQAFAIVGPEADHVDAIVAYNIADEQEVSEYLRGMPRAVEAISPDLSLFNFYHYINN